MQTKGREGKIAKCNRGYLLTLVQKKDAHNLTVQVSSKDTSSEVAKIELGGDLAPVEMTVKLEIQRGNN